jgi:membrane-bound metal-dependent hydrolase YbcI (DUF457 family)
MPQAVTHILVPILIAAVFRDFYLRKNEKAHFPLHYVLIAGIGGVLPDIDIVISVIFNLIGLENWNVHKTFTHSLFFPAIFLILYFVLKPVHKKAKICNLGRHNLKLSTICLILAFGITAHILLDSLTWERAYYFYPFSSREFGINLIDYLPEGLRGMALPTLDGILLVVWIVYLELKHKISDFI